LRHDLSHAGIAHRNSQIPDKEASTYGACAQLDFELELGAFIGGGGGGAGGDVNPLGEPIPIAKAEDHIFGLCILNDWSGALRCAPQICLHRLLVCSP
jgi:2-keto-4-pentenoate hydratase/2-oxohepta-3-ene-1,7-dioic acid hydratase in catechol pathway